METNVQKMEAQNFLGDAFEMLRELNQVNGKDLSKEEKEALLEKLDEFSTAFIYFRESYDESQSNIHKISQNMEDIRQIVAIGEKQYEENENDPKNANKVLMNMIGHIMEQLQKIDEWTKDAVVEETQNRQLSAIKEIFIDTKKDIDGAESIFRNIQGDMKEQSGALRDSMESVQASMSSFENSFAEVKGQLDGFAQIGKDIQTGFDDWKNTATPDFEKLFEEKIKPVNQQYENYLKVIEDKTEKSSKDMERFTEKVDSLFTGEGVKQFLVYGGTALTGLNFILLIIMMFFGK